MVRWQMGPSNCVSESMTGKPMWRQLELLPFGIIFLQIFCIGLQIATSPAFQVIALLQRSDPRKRTETQWELGAGISLRNKRRTHSLFLHTMRNANMTKHWSNQVDSFLESKLKTTWYVSAQLIVSSYHVQQKHDKTLLKSSGKFCGVKGSVGL